MTADTNLNRAPRPELTSVKGDVEKAQEYKAELMEALGVACEVITRAKQKDKINLNFQLAIDAMGKQFVASLTASKEL